VAIARSDARIRNVRFCAAEPPAESVTCTRTCESPVAVVEPVIEPEAVKAMPDGSEPCVTRQEYGGAPPAAESVAAYGAPATPSGMEFVVIVGSPARTEKENARVAADPEESLTRTVTGKPPATAGVPVTEPDEPSERPPGSDPDARLQVYGLVPPVAASVAE